MMMHHRRSPSPTNITINSQRTCRHPDYISRQRIVRGRNHTRGRGKGRWGGPEMGQSYCQFNDTSLWIDCALPRAQYYTLLSISDTYTNRWQLEGKSTWSNATSSLAIYPIQHREDCATIDLVLIDYSHSSCTFCFGATWCTVSTMITEIHQRENLKNRKDFWFYMKEQTIDHITPLILAISFWWSAMSLPHVSYTGSQFQLDGWLLTNGSKHMLCVLCLSFGTWHFLQDVGKNTRGCISSMLGNQAHICHAIQNQKQEAPPRSRRGAFYAQFGTDQCAVRPVLGFAALRWVAPRR